MSDSHGYTADDSGHVVDAFVTEFDYDALDSLESRIVEAIRLSQPFDDLLRDLIEFKASARAAEGIARVICLIADSRKPKLMADHLAWVTGMRTHQQHTAASLAKRHGVTKQAFSQATWKLARSLGIRPARAMRSAKARRSMALAYRARMKASSRAKPAVPVRFAGIIPRAKSKVNVNAKRANSS